MEHAILLLSCPDQKGVTAAVTDHIFRRGGNILDADQHKDEEADIFFMRVEWELDGYSVPREKIAEDIRPLAERLNLRWDLHYTDEVPRMAIFVSKHLHCLYDLLFRHHSGQLRSSIELIISNHTDAKCLADQWGVDFLHVPVTSATKKRAEDIQLKALQQRGIDLIVLARYHQILTQDFVRQYPDRIINIHHSFLPAFVGREPYAQAYHKGVKLIGATSHYVIEALDEGPIIEQDTVRVSHKHSIADMVEMGQDLERVVFYRAVRWHLERKILRYGNKTVVFD